MSLLRNADLTHRSRRCGLRPDLKAKVVVDTSELV